MNPISEKHSKLISNSVYILLFAAILFSSFAEASRMLSESTEESMPSSETTAINKDLILTEAIDESTSPETTKIGVDSTLDETTESMVETSPVKADELANDLSNSLCNQTIIRPYMKTENNSAQKVTEEVKDLCPSLTVGDPFCCGKNNVEEMKKSLRKTSHYRDGVETIKKNINLLTSNSETLLETLKDSEKNKCPKQIEADIFQKNLDAAAKQGVDANISKLYNFNMRINSGFFCKLCAPSFIDNLLPDQSAIIYETSIYDKTLEMMLSDGLEAFKAFVAMDDLFADIYCMGHGKEIAEENKLLSMFREMGTEEFAAFIGKCKEKGTDGLIDKECIEKIRPLNNLNDMTMIDDINTKIQNLKSVLLTTLQPEIYDPDEIYLMVSYLNGKYGGTPLDGTGLQFENRYRMFDIHSFKDVKFELELFTVQYLPGAGAEFEKLIAKECYWNVDKNGKCFVRISSSTVYTFTVVVALIMLMWRNEC